MAGVPGRRGQGGENEDKQEFCKDKSEYEQEFCKTKKTQAVSNVQQSNRSSVRACRALQATGFRILFCSRRQARGHFLIHLEMHHTSSVYTPIVCVCVCARARARLWASTRQKWT